jgi:phosphate uptake regulator
MKRKIIKIAKNTFVVSLPTEWVKKENLSKGDELDVMIKDGKLICTSANTTETTKRITLNVENMNEQILRWAIIAIQKKGWDEITLLNYKEKHLTVIDDLLNNVFIGFVIKEKQKTFLTIGEIAKVDLKELEPSIRRAFRLLNIQIEETIEAFETRNDKFLQQQILHEKNNNQITHFCERLLNNYPNQKDNGHYWYVLAWNLEKISTNFKYISEYFKGAIIPISKATLNILKEIKEFSKDYYNLIYNFSFEELSKLIEKKESIEKKIFKQMTEKNIRHEVVLLHFLHNTVFQMMNFTPSLIALRFEGEQSPFVVKK